MDYILLMLNISSLQTILILLRIPGGQFFTNSCLYSLFGIQKIFQFPTTVPEREKYFPPLGRLGRPAELSAPKKRQKVWQTLERFSTSFVEL